MELLYRQMPFLIGIFLIFSSLQADPWGKDADLVHCSPASTQICSPSLLARWGVKAIRFHQEVISLLTVREATLFLAVLNTHWKQCANMDSLKVSQWAVIVSCVKTRKNGFIAKRSMAQAKR